MSYSPHFYRFAKARGLVFSALSGCALSGLIFILDVSAAYAVVPQNAGDISADAPDEIAVSEGEPSDDELLKNEPPKSALPETQLDAELQDFDDFGVEWPDFDAPETQQPPELPTQPDIASAPIDDDEQSDAEASDFAGADDTDAQSLSLQDQDAPAVTDNILRRIVNDYEISLNFEDNLLSAQDREGLVERFDASSSLEALSDDDSNIAQLRRRADRDRDLLLRLLRIYGHYDGIVESLFASADVQSDVVNSDAISDNGLDILPLSDRLRVNFLVAAGPLYLIDDVDLGDLAKTARDYGYFTDVFGVAKGDPVNSDKIIAGRDNLAIALAENGYAFAQIDDPDLVIDHQARSGNLNVSVAPGEKYRFGTINVGDDPLLSSRHLLRIARFDSGDVFRASRVEDLRRAILATGLASSVSITAVPAKNAPPPPREEDDPPRTGTAGDKTPAPADEIVDLNVDIAAAPLRTVAGELGFGTGQGFRVAASWEHRNFFPPEGLLRLRSVLGTQEQLLGATYRRNNFRQRDTVLNINALIANIQFDSFDARTISLSANIQRQTNLIFQKKWTWSAGTEFVLTNERDISGPNTDGRETFGIAALPVSLAYDGSDDLLNPTSGFRIAGLASPEISLITGNVAYVRAQIDASFYQPFGENIILAGRTRLAGTGGADLFSIAPSRRFYSGGGGSVRGFGFQDIGPLDVNGDPVGGRSLAEFSLEARIRFGDFGVVPFVDAGNVYSNSLPEFSGLRYGAGIGLRYYSSFGPLRLDIGTPINPGPNDGLITVFVSLGQAF